MNRSALLLVLPLLAACDVETRTPESGDDAVSIRADETGEVSFNLPIVRGQVKLPSGMMRNGDIDIDGVKLMPGSSVTGFSVDAANEGATVKMGFSAPASADEVRSYYLDRFKRKGIDAAVEGDAVTGTTKDGSAFAIHVQPAPQGSKGQIEIRAKG